MKLNLVWIVLLSLSFGCASKLKVIPKEEYIFEISRTFNTDAKTLFNFWVNPKLYTQWMGPAGSEMTFIKANVEVGRSAVWRMAMSDGSKKFGKLNYKSIKPNKLIKYTQNFCDKAGRLVKLPTATPYPDVLLMTATLNEVDNAKTKMTVKWKIYREYTEAELKTFKSMRPIMETGWGQSFDKLETMLKSPLQLL